MTENNDRRRRSVPTWLIVTVVTGAILMVCVGLPVVTVLMVVGKGLSYLAADTRSRQVGDQESRAQADWFMTKIAAGDHEAAYSVTAPRYRSRVDLNTFRVWADQPYMKSYTPADLSGPVNASHHKTDSSRRAFTVHIRDRGAIKEFRFYLYKDQGQWYVDMSGT